MVFDLLHWGTQKLNSGVGKYRVKSENLRLGVNGERLFRQKWPISQVSGPKHLKKHQEALLDWERWWAIKKIYGWDLGKWMELN